MRSVRMWAAGDSTERRSLMLGLIRLEGPEDPHRTNSRFLRSRDPAHASLPLAQTPLGLTGRAGLQAGAQQGAIMVSHL